MTYHAISALESQLRSAQEWRDTYVREAKRAADEAAYKLDEIAVQDRRIADIEQAIAQLRRAKEEAPQ